MGMDLEPISPAPNAPLDESGNIKWGRYNWRGWRFLIDKLREWGVDTKEFKGVNDGDVISATTCYNVGRAIEKNIHTLDKEDQDWLRPHILLWQTCGGYRQF